MVKRIAAWAAALEAIRAFQAKYPKYAYILMAFALVHESSQTPGPVYRLPPVPNADGNRGGAKHQVDRGMIVSVVPPPDASNWMPAGSG